jgi:hypothetical protein
MRARPYGQIRSTVTLDGKDVCALLRLWGHLHEPGVPTAERKRRLIRGLCNLLGARAGTSYVTVLAPDTGRRDVVSVVRATTGGKEPTPVPWHESPVSPALLQPPRGGHWIEWPLSLQRGPTVVASLALARGAAAAPSAARAVAVLRLVHEESRWLYGADLALASPRVRRLPALRRFVLQYLLAGESEADVARWLGIGLRTVRREAKAAYKVLGAADREAFPALWAERT